MKVSHQTATKVSVGKHKTHNLSQQTERPYSCLLLAELCAALRCSLRALLASAAGYCHCHGPTSPKGWASPALGTDSWVT